jgi:hypothetical protein
MMQTHEGLLTFDRAAQAHTPEPDTAVFVVTPSTVTLIAEDGERWIFDRTELAAIVGTAPAQAAAA